MTLGTGRVTPVLMKILNAKSAPHRCQCLCCLGLQVEANRLKAESVCSDLNELSRFRMKDWARDASG